MIIGIYTDAHFSKSSSIFNQTKDCKYSARLDMLVASFKWMYEEFSKRKVDLIVNGGDLLDSTVLDSSTISALSEALSYSKGISELHLLGNHEKESSDGKINSVSLLSGFRHIKLCTTPTKIDDECSVLPYMAAKDAESYDLSSIKSKILFSHVNYHGMQLGPYKLDEGISLNYVSSIFDLVLNGHIHTYGSYNDGKVINIGSMVGHGLGDTYTDNVLPSIMILDTRTLKFIRVQNPYSVIFLNYKVGSISELNNKLSSISSKLSPTNPVVLKVTVPYDLRTDFSSYIDSLKYVTVSRLVSNISSQASMSNEMIESIQSSNIDRMDSDTSSIAYLHSYIDALEDSKLPAPKDKVLKFIDTYVR